MIGEERRVLDVCDALQRGDYATVGERMYATHEGLSKDYEVSCEELDFLVDVARECGVTGARMMGGGFGGRTSKPGKDDLLPISSPRPNANSPSGSATNPKSIPSSSRTAHIKSTDSNHPVT